jgi:hypothetical protein
MASLLVESANSGALGLLDNPNSPEDNMNAT